MYSQETQMKRKHSPGSKRDFLVVPLMLFILLLVIFSARVLARDEQQKTDRQQDIEIMENVLDKLIINESPIWFSSRDGVHGVYLDDFGVLFDLKSIGFRFKFDLEELGYNVGKLVGDFTRGFSDGVSEEEEKELEARINKARAKTRDDATRKLTETKALLHEFYLDYASAVNSLDDDERICVNIRLKNDYELLGNEDKPEIPDQLRVCVSMAELSDYRRGKIDREEMLERINFQEIYADDTDRDIEIMSRIIDTALEAEREKGFLGLSNQTRGMYLEDFGALFFSPSSIMEVNIEKKIRRIEREAEDMEAELERHREIEREIEREVREMEAELPEPEDDEIVIKKAPQKPDSIRVRINRKPVDVDLYRDFELSASERDSILNSIQNNLLELLGQYGHTLRKVKDDQYILVAVELRNVRANEDDYLYLKVRKADIIKFSRERIDFDKFRQQAKIWTG